MKKRRTEGSHARPSQPKAAQSAGRPEAGSEAGQDRRPTPPAEDDPEDGLAHMSPYIDPMWAEEWDGPFDVIVPPSEDEAPAEDGEPERRRRPWLYALAVLLAVLFVVLAVGAHAFMRSAERVEAASRAAYASAADFAFSLQAGRTSMLEDNAEAFGRAVEAMEEETSAPVWKAACFMPFIGADARRVAEMGAIMHSVSEGVMTPMAGSLAGVPVGGVFQEHAIDVATLSKMADAVVEVEPALADAANRAEALGAADTDRLAGPLGETQKLLRRASIAAGKVSIIAPELPAMLGASGPRTYLLAIQNSAQLRSTGGIPETQLLLTVDKGKVSTSGVTGEAPKPIAGIPLTDEERHVVVDLMKTKAADDPGSVNAVPSFPRAAQLLAWCWKKEKGQDVDGVLAVDPVFLQRLLGLAGGVTVADGKKIDGENEAKILVSELSSMPEDKQRAAFSQLSSLSIEAILGSMNRMELANLVSTLHEGTNEGRFLVYMKDEGGQKAARALGATGEASDAPSHPVTGLYLSDISGTMLDWYLIAFGEVSDPVQNADGTLSYRVSATVENLLKEGDAAPGAASGHALATGYCVLSGAGAKISDFTIEGASASTQEEAPLYGNDAWAGTVAVAPGSAVRISWTATVAPEAEAPLGLWITPTAQAPQRP